VPPPGLPAEAAEDGGGGGRLGWQAVPWSAHRRLLHAPCAAGPADAADVALFQRRFPAESADVIYAAGVLEFSTYHEEGVPRVLRAWAAALKPRGALLLSVPDLRALAARYADPLTPLVTRLALMRVIFGEQAPAPPPPPPFSGDSPAAAPAPAAPAARRTGLDEELLSVLLLDAGFCSVERVAHFGLFPGDLSSARVGGAPVALNVVARACAAELEPEPAPGHLLRPAAAAAAGLLASASAAELLRNLARLPGAGG
jgi:hypothetical protein